MWCMKNNIDFVIPSLKPDTTILDNGLKVYAFKNDSMDVKIGRASCRERV